jgi:hypothetical protein
MTRTSRGLLELIALGLLVGGCVDATVSSDAIRTKGIWASFNIKATKDGRARATAELRVGGETGTVIDDLIAPDKLTFQIADGEKEELGTSCEENNIYCTANVAEPVAGKLVTFGFDRGDADENALDSTVKMPAAFEVGTDVENLVRGGDLPIEVTGSSSSVQWKVKGDCVWGASGTLSAGRIPAKAFESPASDEEEDCDVVITFTRSATGDLDPNFGKGGEVTATQERQLTLFTLAPGSAVSPVVDPTSEPDASSEPGDAGIGAADGGADASAAPDSGVGADAGADGGTGQSGMLESSVDAAATSNAGSTDAEDAGVDGGRSDAGSLPG